MSNYARMLHNQLFRALLVQVRTVLVILMSRCFFSSPWFFHNSCYSHWISSRGNRKCPCQSRFRFPCSRRVLNYVSDRKVGSEVTFYAKLMIIFKISINPEKLGKQDFPDKISKWCGELREVPKTYNISGPVLQLTRSTPDKQSH